MKKLLCLLMALMLCSMAFAEESTIQYDLLLPVRALPQEEAAVPMEEAITIAKQAQGNMPEELLIRATLTETADGSRVWVVVMFNTATLVDAWCVTVNAESGELIFGEGPDFFHTRKAWTDAKGLQALWTLEDKQLYDALYALLPTYGLPVEGDMSAEAALDKALSALGLTSAGGYEVGYGYLMGGEGYNGVWEICLVVDGLVDCRVNLDAVTGEVYYLERNELEPDEANG